MRVRVFVCVQVLYSFFIFFFFYSKNFLKFFYLLVFSLFIFQNVEFHMMIPIIFLVQNLFLFTYIYTLFGLELNRINVSLMCNSVCIHILMYGGALCLCTLIIIKKKQRIYMYNNVLYFFHFIYTLHLFVCW